MADPRSRNSFRLDGYYPRRCALCRRKQKFDDFPTIASLTFEWRRLVLSTIYCSMSHVKTVPDEYRQLFEAK